MNAIENGWIVINAAYVLVFFVVFRVARALFAEDEIRAAREDLEDSKGHSASNGLVRITRPFFTQYVVPMIRGKPLWENKRKAYKRKLISSGLKDELTADEFIAFKFFLILFFPLIGGFLKVGDFLDLEWHWVLASGIAGWFYSDFWVSTRIKERQEKILRAMPFVVDLLALSTEAGLDFIGAIGKVVDKAKPSPLIEELSQVLKEIKVGSSRAEALREMALRIGMTEVNSFVAILVSADQMGASIGKILRQQSDQIRVERSLRAEKAGAKAAGKLLLPTGIIVLAVMIMVLGPVGLGFL